MYFHQHPSVAAQLAHDRAALARGRARPDNSLRTRWRSTCRLVILATAIGLAIASTAKAAPTLVADRSCYSLLTPVTLTGDGFTPDGDVLLAGTVTYPDGTTAEAGTVPGVADDQGRVEAMFGVPQIDFRRLTFAATVSDLTRIAQGAPAAEQSVVATFSIAPFGAYFGPWNTDGPARAHPGRRARLEVDGFIGTASRILYVHYVRRGRAVKTQRVGRLDRECGSLTTPFRQFSFRSVKPGAYRVIFDTTRRWPNTDAWSAYRRVVVSKARARVGRAGEGSNLRTSVRPFRGRLLDLVGPRS